ncbi:MAG: hypothetical protein GY778_18430 [bacterium]|nr:hypothetical protein [bacterium]
MTVSTDHSQVLVAQPVRLIVEVSAPEELEVTLPDVIAALEDFGLRDHGAVESEPVGNSRIWRQWFEIDSTLPGSRRIPPLTANLTEGDLTSPELTIEVASVIEGEVDPTQIADIEGPVALTQPREWKPGYLGAAAAIALALFIWWMLRRWSAQRAAVAPPPPPHVWVLQQLEALLAERLVERGQVHEFYYRLSGLLRTYIELRFGLMAPERTTDEFLVEVRRSSALRFGHQDLLGEFLTRCDLVKFARHEPAGTEIDGAIDVVRRFVEQTAPAAEPSPREAAA